MVKRVNYSRVMSNGDPVTELGCMFTSDCKMTESETL